MDRDGFEAEESEDGPREVLGGQDGSMDKVTGPKKSGTELAARQAPQRARAGALERSWVKHRLIRDLALEEHRQTDLAKVYGVSDASITNFKKRHFYEIEQIRNQMADEYAGAWVAEKKNRILAYQDKVEEMLDGRSPRHAEVLVTILKAVAEELGDLPARTQVNVSTESVTYQIVGINPEDLS